MTKPVNSFDKLSVGSKLLH